MADDRLRSIEEAPEDDGWVLAYVTGAAPHLPYHPWQIITRCDGGWCTEAGYRVDPVTWMPLPDPQPTPTGWARAVGTIGIAPIYHPEPTDIEPGWVVFVRLPDGEDDPMREPWVCGDRGDARETATKQAAVLGLPIEPAGLRLVTQ